MPVVPLAPLTCAVYAPAGSVNIMAESALPEARPNAPTLDMTALVAGWMPETTADVPWIGEFCQPAFVAITLAGLAES